MIRQAPRSKLIGLATLIILLMVAANSACNRTLNYAVRVQAENTGEDIANAEVSIDTRDGMAPLCSVTDAGGFARIGVGASYMGQDALLIVKAPGYKKHTQEIDFTEGNLTQVVLLQPKIVLPIQTVAPTGIPAPTSMPTTRSVTPTITADPLPSPTKPHQPRLPQPHRPHLLQPQPPRPR